MNIFSFYQMFTCQIPQSWKIIFLPQKKHSLNTQSMKSTQTRSFSIEYKEPIKQEICKWEQKIEFSKKEYAKLETDDSEVSTKYEVLSTTESKQPNFPSGPLNFRKEIEKMIEFMTSSIEKISQQEIENYRTAYPHNPCLLQIYDKLILKYSSAMKSKEDSIRYILGKFLKKLKESIRRKEKISSKDATVILCKRYFRTGFEGNIHDGASLVEYLLPYKKNSKNKTMNTSFISEVFSYEEFRAEYKIFLDEFDSYLKADNNRKRQKLINLLMAGIKNNSLQIGVLREFHGLRYG